MNQVSTNQETQAPTETDEQLSARYDALYEIEEFDQQDAYRGFFIMLSNGDINRAWMVGSGPERAKLLQPAKEGSFVRYISHEKLTSEHQEELKALYDLQLQQESIMGSIAVDRAAVQPTSVPERRPVPHVMNTRI